MISSEFEMYRGHKILLITAAWDSINETIYMYTHIEYLFKINCFSYIRRYRHHLFYISLNYMIKDFVSVTKTMDSCI